MNQQNQQNQHVDAILSHPEFQKMVRQKAILCWSFTAVIVAVYVAYIWVIGSNPALFAQKVSANGVTTVGIYVGIFVIVFSFVITLVYIILANGYFERLTQKVAREVMGEK